MGFKPMTKFYSALNIEGDSLTNSGFDGIQTHVHHRKYFPAYEIPKEQALKPMTKYYSAF